MTSPPISNSEITDFKRCPRMHSLKHGARLLHSAELPPTAPTVLGTTIHSVLEAYYTGTPADVLLAELDADVHNPAANTVYRSVDAYFSYLESSGADSGFTSVSAERELVRTHPTTGHVFCGKVDLIGEAPHMTTIVDFKTTNKYPTAKLKELEHTDQGVHYAWLLGRPVVVEFRVIKRFSADAPDAELVRSWSTFVSQDTLDAYTKYLAKIGQKTFNNRSNNNPLPYRDMDCHWRCSFAPDCRVLDVDPDYGMELIRRTHHTGNPLERYSSVEVDV